MEFPVPNLRQMTVDLVNQVPCGKITTYRAIARALGDEVASRAVGRIIAECEHNSQIPVHRVICSDGRLISSGSPGRSLLRAERLRSEGLPVYGCNIENFNWFLFEEFDCDQPLRRIKQIQIDIAQRVCTEAFNGKIKTVAGVDLSYCDQWAGVGAYVLMKLADQQVMSTNLLTQQISFPYIPTYLAYRELPVLLKLLQNARVSKKLADVVLVDGSGILHPRQVGIASHLGVLLDVPTIGITKSKLYGSVRIRGMRAGEVREIINPEDGQVIGAAVKTTERALPIYVSVGHRIDLKMAVDLVIHLSNKKLPEPIFKAHHAGREAAKKMSKEHKHVALF